MCVCVTCVCVCCVSAVLYSEDYGTTVLPEHVLYVCPSPPSGSPAVDARGRQLIRHAGRQGSGPTLGLALVPKGGPGWTLASLKYLDMLITWFRTQLCPPCC